MEDGRLRPGDRLLEVNGVEMTGKTQAEAVTVLRNAPAGSVVHIVVSRQDDSTSTAGSSPQSNYTVSKAILKNVLLQWLRAPILLVLYLLSIFFMKISGCYPWLLSYSHCYLIFVAGVFPRI